MDSETTLTSTFIPKAKPIFVFISALGWVASAFNAVAILMSLYLLLMKIKWSWTRFINDFHYRLRFVLCIFLFLNRASQMTHLWLSYKSFSVEDVLRQLGDEATQESVSPSLFWENDRLFKARRILHVILMSCLYIMMALLLFLTLDRYRRVHMVLPGTWLYRFFAGLVGYIVLGVAYICIGYGLDYLPKVIVGVNVWRFDTTWQMAILIRQFTEFGCMLIGMSVYYIFTFRLIWKSIGSQVFVKLFGKKQDALGTPDPLEHDHAMATSPIDDQGDLVKKQVAIVQYQKLNVVLKMMGLFGIIVLVDAATFLTMILENFKVLQMTDETFENLNCLTGSWIVFHVWAVFELLDMFIRDLRNARHVPSSASNRSSSRRRGWFQRLKSPIQSDETQKTDIVDMSLLSEFMTTGKKSLASPTSLNVSIAMKETSTAMSFSKLGSTADYTTEII